MPKLRKCCVVGCNANNETHRLFNFPKDDKLRELWLSYLVPVNDKLSGLTKEQLLNRYVCQKHFDRYQFDSMGNRLAHGYPCLFTAKEMLHGIPLRSDNESHEYHLGDHNYSLLPTVEGSTGSTNTTISNAEADKNDYSYVLNQHMEASTSSKIADLTCNMQKSQHKKAPTRYLSKGRDIKLTTNCRCFIRTIKKIANKENKMQKSFSERLETAKNLGNDNLFKKKFAKMTNHAQDFLLMQLKMANRKKQAMRYSTNEKLLSLSLMKESPKGYRLLQKIFNLPSKRTLNRLAERIKFNVGLNDNIFRLLKHKIQKWDIKKKLCSILFDEVALTPHLTYVESQDEIVGFKDFGNEREFKFCDHALVFMIKGICSSWRQPIAFYFCEGTTAAATVTQILKEVVTKVSQAGLIPLAVVCDQGSTFRTALKMIRRDTERKRVLNGEHNDGTIEISGQQISVVYDPPHLLKGLRNNLLTKEMMFKGKVASWEDILTIYNADCQLGHTRMNKKLTEQHVYSDKMKKMKVSVAAQALSATTSAMLKYTALFKTTATGEIVSETMATTGEAVEFIDKLFDSVNGSRGSTVKGKLRGPIKLNSKHFGFWQEAKEILKNITFIDKNSKKARKNNKTYKIRVPSLDGWMTTIESFERLSKLLFEKYEIEYFYPRSVNQDPLENFFGRVRAINYRNVNPDANTFINSFKSLLMSNVMGPHSIYGNCEKDEGDSVVDFLELLSSPRNHEATDENKENVVPITLAQGSCNINQSLNAANERVRVHSSAYTAGYICRRLTKKFNCKNCSDTYAEKQKDSIHQWINQREYSLLKHSNLSYPSKRFLMLYRDISGLIHDHLNKYAHEKCVKKHLKNEMYKVVDFNWFGCTEHAEILKEWAVNLILRIHVHHWCNIINKVLKGGIQVKLHNQLSLPQKLAYEKYKTHRLRKQKT